MTWPQGVVPGSASPGANPWVRCALLDRPTGASSPASCPSRASAGGSLGGPRPASSWPLPGMTNSEAPCTTAKQEKLARPDSRVQPAGVDVGPRRPRGQRAKPLVCFYKRFPSFSKKGFATSFSP